MILAPTSNGDGALQPKDAVAPPPDDDATVMPRSNDETSSHIQQEEMQPGRTDILSEGAGSTFVDAQDTAASSEAQSQATAASSNVTSNVAPPRKS